MILNGVLAFFNLGTGEIIAIVVVILLLKGLKSFKQGMNEVEDELKKPLDELDKKEDPK